MELKLFQTFIFGIMAASTNYNQNPSSSTSPPTSWDVFLSFRGLDTRNTFTSHLYKDLCRNGIKTFKDDPELLGGEVISRVLPQAIQESKTYIVVLSENYASSSWCLDELEEILRCYKRLERLVVPVFYYIDPSVVRHQNGSFKEAFEKHQTRYDVEKLNNWRLTLKEVADFSGYDISQNRSQADIVDEVVHRVLLAINPMTLDVAKYPVGLDSRVRSISTLLKSDPESVIRIGIHGMGGVGKTTLAKAVYNQHYKRFQGSCFLANVREVSRTEQGVVCLQKQLVGDVLKCTNINIGNVDQGIELIRARICSRKVLIVIDDLDNPNQLEVLEGPFALGSITIITTRNEDLLDSIKVQGKYKVNELDDDQSRQLFAQHAFGDYKIPDKFTDLSKDILKRAGGLPLALKVFGSNMLNNPAKEWGWFIDKLNRVPMDDIEKKLLISFDTLKSIDPMLQNIFLDIACFYIGLRVDDKVIEIMETCYTYVHRNIDILKKRCMITIDENGILGMHDLLRDMGREIARNNSSDEPGKHSRLWVSEDISTVLKNHKGTEAIHGIISGDLDWFYMKKDEEVTFDAESFKMMSKLRFLYLDKVNLTGSFEQTFEDLRWFCWKRCPLECLPSKFYPQKLVVLELPFSKIRTMGEQNMVFKKLKTLDMSYSTDLITAPDFTRFPCLETLNLQDCSNLRSLPDSIYSLRALEVLIVDGCSGLEALPTELGSIESLKKLRAGSLSVSKLPDSVGRLSNLVELGLSRNKNLETLPDSIWNLRSLEILDISDCEKLEELPDQLGMITSLTDDTMLRMLPDISQLSDKEHLDINDCDYRWSIAELPTSLKSITAHGCTSLKRLPDLSNLKQLKRLELGFCEALKEIQGLEEITSLNDLGLSYCKSLQTLPNLCNLKNLELLNLEYCGNLLSVTKFPPYLLWVEAYDCRSLKRLPNLSNLKELEKLILCNCEALKEIQGLEELTALIDLDLHNCKALQRLPNLCNLKHLERLKISNCGNLLSVSKLPPNLQSLDATGCRSLKKLPNLSNLKHLKKLDLFKCGALKEIQGLEEVTYLRFFNISYCGNLLNIPELSPYLKHIIAKHCWSIKRLPNLSNLKHLETLDLTRCCGLTEIQGLEELTSLEVLKMAGCSSSLLAHTFTKLFFEKLSGFGQSVNIYIGEKDFGEWISQLNKDELVNRDCQDWNIQLQFGSRISVDLRPNEAHNFLGIILAFEDNCGVEYWVKNITSGSIWSDYLEDYTYWTSDVSCSIVIVPSSILSIRDGDDRIEITTDKEIYCGIHLLYKTDKRWTRQ